jgi:N-acetylmuramoyl-L-alanine amidase
MILPVLAISLFSPFGHCAPSAASVAIGALYPERSTVPIVVIAPPEGLSMPMGEGEFILGSVSDPTAPFFINGATVAVHPNGAFLAWLPISTGTFTFRCTLNLKNGATTFLRTISVTAPPPALPEKPMVVDADSLWPKADVGLRPGDWLSFRMRASPHHEARCRLAKGPWQDLRETGSGNYEGLQAIVPGQEAGPAAVECLIKNGWSTARALSRGQVTVTSQAPLIAVAKGNSVLRTGPGAGYMAYPLAGTRLAVTGRQGPELRVSLSPSLEGWIDAKDVDLLPAGTSAPHAVAEAIHTYASDHGASVRLALSERVAFTLDEGDDPSVLTLRLYNCAGHTNWIIYDSNDRFIEEVRWKQESTGVVAVLIRLNPAMTLWGWQAAYEGSLFKLDLRRAPTLAPAPASPLKGLNVILDPGHMPSASGATGPLGTREMDANYAIATAAAAQLAKRGAIPILTRASADDEVGLPDRPRLALERKGDLFISIHNNALGDGENPFSRSRGYSVFYYHPHSLALARQMYHSYERHSPLPGEELRYGNLLVARLSAMPAILIENAYMIVPSQEEMLSEPAFRGKLAEAIADGLESFLSTERAKQPQSSLSSRQATPLQKAAAKKGHHPRQSSSSKAQASAKSQKRQQAALDELLSAPEPAPAGTAKPEKKP